MSDKVEIRSRVERDRWLYEQMVEHAEPHMKPMIDEQKEHILPVIEHREYMLEEIDRLKGEVERIARERDEHKVNSEAWSDANLKWTQENAQQIREIATLKFRLSDAMEVVDAAKNVMKRTANEYSEEDVELYHALPSWMGWSDVNKGYVFT